MNREEALLKKNRKTRSDKKRDVKPSVSPNLKNCLSLLAYITNQPVKTIIETIFVKSLKSNRVIDYLSQFFKRNYDYKNTLYVGSLESEYIDDKTRKVRVTTRLNKPQYEQLAALAYSLDMTPTKALAVIIDAGVKNTNILNSIIREYLHDNLDNNRIKELKNILRFINQNNPYDEKVSWFNLMSLIEDDVKSNSEQFKNKITNFLDRYK